MYQLMNAGGRLDFVILKGIPLPPSINEAYMNNMRGRGPGRVRTGKYRQFERDMAIWVLRNRAVAEQAERLIGPEGWIQVDAYFCYPHFSLVTKAGTPKRHDVDNRLKVLNDSLGKVLAFNDCRIVRQTIEKIAMVNLAEAYVNVVITRKSRIADAWDMAGLV